MGQQNGQYNGNSSSSSIRNRRPRNGSSSSSMMNGHHGTQNGGGPYSSSSSTSSTRGVRFETGTLFLGDNNNGDNNDGYYYSTNGGDNNASFVDNVISWCIDAIYGGLAFQCFLGLMTIVIFLYLIVRPFSVTVYRRLVNQIGLNSYLEAVGLLLPSTRICLTGDSDVPSPVGTAILVSNHVMDADWYSTLMLGRCLGLRGSVKVFLRNEFLHLNKETTTETTTATGTSNTSSPSSRNGSITNAASSGGSMTQLNQVGMWKVADPKNGTNSYRNNIPNGNDRASSSSSSTTSALAHTNGSNGGTLAIPAAAASSTSTSTTHSHSSEASLDLKLIASFLRSFLEFPLIDEEDYVSDRKSLFELLRSFADDAPVHFLLYPEGWSLYNGENRQTVLARSNEFAKREGRPQLKHLLLPRTTGFNASISCLRESNPVVYDMTVAYRGYDGSIPPKGDLSVLSLWGLLRRKYPTEIHIRMKRYSMEEVLQDSSWLDKQWAEKDRLLDYFSRHNTFPMDRRGFSRHRIFETRMQSMEQSIVSLVRLLLLPCAVPVLLFLSIPILWTTFWVWLFYQGYQAVMNADTTNTTSQATTSNDNDDDGPTPGTSSQTGTPFTPATPFASPSITNWRDMLFNPQHRQRQ